MKSCKECQKETYSGFLVYARETMGKKFTNFYCTSCVGEGLQYIYRMYGSVHATVIREG